MPTCNLYDCHLSVCHCSLHVSILYSLLDPPRSTFATARLRLKLTKDKSTLDSIDAEKAIQINVLVKIVGLCRIKYRDVLTKIAIFKKFSILILTIRHHIIITKTPQKAIS